MTMFQTTVESVMEERFPAVSPNETIEEAVHTLHETGIGEIPVEEDNIIRGMLREKDLLRLGELDLNPSDPFFLFTVLFSTPADEIQRHVEILNKGRVRDVMRKKFERLAPDDVVKKAIHLLATGDEVLPVVDDDDHLLGIVTRDSVLRHVVRHEPV
ncbi:MAG: CBS domain-containing protein [Candidatus Undinarchaeales archaeon]|jgi:CBS domain-containing protein|nr:CBS domain-containing protein [Candidatus Undinarchaeales archaeon]MDP7491859.1 CBS domain-containing protein [Candidatus Undinarchaeales archaeon]